MKSRIWIAIFIGSTIGGFVPSLWGGTRLSYAGVLMERDWRVCWIVGREHDVTRPAFR